ncbi:MAG: hypothetical protein A2677_02050 [Candidatus Komeilibacteria bacterium RIFCSPHIGHO2_01_FULL_52_14]|uniref:Uncharacterized protein n=1 Tax=Candidatus Komeilibacteria bacterium RIFCSPHIGHO2_01_FULL_52_14 TaxID=1798549 RepID=A0A1G2BK78_9BACT|nr:MAG: hypothetical protein A2677_02050 [Candidatus Komeilibacteria bacterium RIFCSPHIGHO2_01_FULL_52_14]
MADTRSTTVQKSSGTRYPIVVIVLLLLAIGSGAMAFSYKSQLQALKANPQKAAQEETRELIARVGKLIVLPSDEEPTIATVADPEKLKDQPFFAKAKAGDRVLIYTNARKAILYDPVSNKIIEVAPVNIGNAQAPQPAPAPEPTPAPEPSTP